MPVFPERAHWLDHLERCFPGFQIRQARLSGDACGRLHFGGWIGRLTPCILAWYCKSGRLRYRSLIRLAAGFSGRCGS